MADILAQVLIVLAVAAVAVMDYRRSPHCRWCNSRHRGRCIFNPRAGRVFANTNDGHFDYDDPNQ